MTGFLLQNYLYMYVYKKDMKYMYMYTYILLAEYIHLFLGNFLIYLFVFPIFNCTRARARVHVSYIFSIEQVSSLIGRAIKLNLSRISNFHIV